MFRLLFRFEGRINRARFWLGTLIAVFFYLGSGAVVYGFVIDSAPSFFLFFMLPALFYGLALLSGTAVAAKRLHDRNKSSWWLSILYLVPFIKFGLPPLTFVLWQFFGLEIPSIVAALAHGTLGMTVSAIAAAGLIWAVVELGILRGTIGPNRYGPDPL